MQAQIVNMTAGELAEARRIGRALVEERVAACVNIIDGMHALYRWEGEVQESHNLLRRFLLAHHVPKDADGQPVMGPVCAATWGGMESVHHLEQIRDIRAHGLAYDYYWIDAGWYGPADSFSPDVYQGSWAAHVGHWSVNPAAHPDGLKPLADAAHARDEPGQVAAARDHLRRHIGHAVSV
jgi:hypothetical protein